MGTVSLQFVNNYQGTFEVARNLTASQLAIQTFNAVTVTVDNGFTLSVHTGNVQGMGPAPIKFNGAGTLAVTGTPTDFGTFSLAAPAVTRGVTTLTIDANSSMTLGLGTVTLDGENLTNSGAINWQQGDIATAGASTVTNQGSFLVTGGDHTYAAGADLTNNGLFSVMLTGSTNNLNFNSAFNNTLNPALNAPVVSVGLGNLRLTGTDTSNAEVSVNGALYVTGTFTASAGATITGSGTVELNGAAAHLGAESGLTLTVSPLIRLLRNGQLEGAGFFQLGGGLFSNNGYISDTNVQTASVNLSSDVAGGTALKVDGSAFQFAGGSWTSGQIRALSNSTLRNVGSFTVSSTDGVNVPAGDTASFLNTSSGTLNFQSDATFLTSFESAGTMNVAGKTVKFNKGLSQTGGTVNLSSGTFDFLNTGLGYALTAGAFKANGTVTGGPLTLQGGTMELTGVLALTGDLTLGAGGTLLVDTPQAEPWGQMNVTGNVTLGGTLAVNLMGGSAPPAGSQTIITSTGAVTGDFATVPADWQVNRPDGKTVKLQKI